MVPPGEAEAWLAPLPVSRLWGAGPKTQQRLIALGFNTIGAVAALDPTRLEGELGALGRRFGDLARGLDPRDVSGARAARGLSSERTPRERRLDAASDRGVSTQRRRNGCAAVATTRRAGQRRSDQAEGRQLVTRQRALAKPSDVASELYATGVSLLDSIELGRRFRPSGSARTTSNRRSISRSSRCRSWTDARDASRQRSTESKSASARAPCSVLRSCWRTVA